jgi:hypothetical protein
MLGHLLQKHFLCVYGDYAKRRTKDLTELNISRFIMAQHEKDKILHFHPRCGLDKAKKSFQATVRLSRIVIKDNTASVICQ